MGLEAEDFEQLDDLASRLERSPLCPRSPLGLPLPSRAAVVRLALKRGLPLVAREILSVEKGPGH